MSRLEHPNCVSVSDFGVEHESPYLVLDYVAGLTLRQVMQMQAGPMPAGRAVAIVKQVLAGLSHAHHHGIVHRDMKPDNVLVTEIAGHGEQARIADFGLAKLRDDVTVTTGVALGTPSYMSPEQTIGQSADARTDIYAVGIILFELLVGRKPFQAESPFDLMRFHRESPVPPLGASVPEIAFSKQMEAIVQKALAKDGVYDGVCPRSPHELKERGSSWKFKKLQRRRAQTEGRVAIIKNVFLGRPLRSKGFEHRALSVTWTVLTHNLWVLARLTIAAREAARAAQAAAMAA